MKRERRIDRDDAWRDWVMKDERWQKKAWEIISLRWKREREYKRQLWVTIIIALIGAAILIFVTYRPAHASCAQMHQYARAAAADMARRDSMDHSWFDRNRRHGAGGAENVGVGFKTREAMMAGWWRSPGHAANMRRGYPCQAVASARSRSGRIYWAMELGR